MLSDNSLKVALIHDQLTQYGGAEKVLESLIDLFPKADIYTSFYIPENLSEKINNQKITPLLNLKKPGMGRLSKHLTAVLPVYFERLDLRKYDLVISDGTFCPKGVLTTPEQLHISYIHTPPRFLYGYSTESQKSSKFLYKAPLMLLGWILRLWDFQAAQRPDYLIANSSEVQRRIKKFYGRESTVISPPVEVENPNTSNEEVHVVLQEIGMPEKFLNEGFYLSLGRIVKYKNVDLVCRAFKECNKNLVVAGTGPEEVHLKSAFNRYENIFFTGRVTEKAKSALFRKTVCLVSAVENEDAGITILEPAVYGKPVLCHKSGGPLETVLEGKTGEYYQELTEVSLIAGLDKIERGVNDNFYQENFIKEHVQKYSSDNFKNKIQAFISEMLENRK